VAYIRKGWATIPLHHVTADGSCSCRWAATDEDHGAGGKSVAKHPLNRGWQSGAAMSLADAFATWGEDAPDSNIGIRTGRVSGFWVLDVDPDNGGDVSLQRMTEENGPLPRTYVVRTGSGGTHYYFSMPLFEVTNGSNRALAQAFGPGLDIRGEGGQVVAAPSVTGKGEYRVLDDTEPAPAPGWLLELLQAGVAVTPIVDSPVVEDLPSVGDLNARDQDRVQRYAERVCEMSAEEYREAPPGMGNAALFRAAVSMIEIAQSPWNTVTVSLVHTMLDRARRDRRDVHPAGGGQDETEFSVTWESARNRAIGQGRALPPDPNAGVAFDPSLFLPADEVPDTAPPQTRDEAQSLVDEMISKLMTAEELANLPAPRPIIRGLYNRSSGVWTIGAPGSFKSFIVLDQAACIGTGRPWQGREVHQGLVLYIAAEGAAGMTLRTRAWQKRYGPMTGVKFLPLPIRFKDQVAWATLEAVVHRLQPVMVVIDTQARVTAGMNENDNGEMGEFAAAVTRMEQAAGGACVHVVHHTGRNGGDARGASAIDGAQDTELKLERIEPRSSLRVKLLQDKQKDRADGGEPITLKLEVVELGTDPETGEHLSSLVVAERDPFSPIPVPAWVSDLPEVKRNVVTVLNDHGRVLGMTGAEIIRSLKERGMKNGRNTVYTALNELIEEEVPPMNETLLVREGKARFLLNRLVFECESGPVLSVPEAS
jgi:hypothetical protein